MRSFFLAPLAIALMTGVAWAGSVSGEYVEARNAEMWTGPCTQNAQIGLVGDKAIMAWRVKEGVYDGVRLDGLAVAAVVFGDGTFGMGETVKTQTVFVVDDRADSSQRSALIDLAKKLAGDTIQQVVAVDVAPVRLDVDHAHHSGSARLDAGIAKIRTRRMYASDHACASERMAYPVLAEVEDEYGAYALESMYSGREFRTRFDHSNTCSAVIGKFSL